MEVLFLFPMLLIGTIAGLVIYLSMRHQRQRREFLTAWAHQRGWTFHPAIADLPRRWAGPPFVGGRVPAREVLTGDFHGHQALSFAYVYTTGSGDNRTTHSYHVVALHLPAPLPWLRLSPEGFGAGLRRFLGGRDIQFESQVFNDSWWVEGPEGQYPFDVIHPRMMERLMQHDALGRNICIEGQDIYLWAAGSHEIRHIDFYLNLLLGIVQLIPRHVWLRVGHDPLSDPSR